MMTIDKLSYQSKLRYVNASEKFVYAMLTLVLCAVGRCVPAAAVVFCVNAFLSVRMGGISFFRYIRLFLVPVSFFVFGSAAVVLNLSETPMDAFAVSVGHCYITGSSYTILKMADLCVTAMACVSCMFFLALNTTMPDMINVLKKIHIPELIIELMILTYRFIFLLADTAATITTAQNSRLGNRNFRVKITSFGSLASGLFIYSIRRAGALYDSMESRCYDGVLHVLTIDRKPEKREAAFIVLFEILLFVLTIWSILT